ncbi:cobalt-precorrin-6A reductase [Pseudonocardia xinjiangensis]|uniref:Cobalt-precorrin-6A reductase n=1 Tax=Pseudonocardia xinjiangensis TaxID=75289 RepID=A0ABX1RF98_9PSEU|nr:cobalt-precorrin-6A reductase [Pseudonocardia xinjiangensis]NMH78040.1 cobalt-precorrin-6A reductase [Pseudonocardia xinjiangensis]
MKVLVLGGTGQARRLVAALHGRPGFTVTSSLAGRVAVPALPPGDVRIGGFGGVDGLVAWLRSNGTDAVVDATHPFAAGMSANAVAATTATGVPLLSLRRPGWTAGPGDRWHRVPDAAAAAALLPALGERVFLTTGHGDLAAFAALDRLWFLLRCVDPPLPPLPARCHVVLGRGPFTADSERELLREHRIDVLVTRDSGGEMTAAKLVAARELGVPVVLLDRPPAPDVPAVVTVEEAVTWLKAAAQEGRVTPGGTPPAPRAAAPDAGT